MGKKWKSKDEDLGLTKLISYMEFVESFLEFKLPYEDFVKNRRTGYCNETEN